MPKYYHPDADFFTKRNLAVPTTVTHGTEDDVKEKMTELKPTDWKMEGPGKLVGQTEMGRLVVFVDPSYICKGTDENGKPILVKIDE